MNFNVLSFGISYQINYRESFPYGRKTGWKGLKYEYVAQLLLIDTSSIDLQDELRFTQENAELLMKNSADFDTWVTEVVGDLENFTNDK